MQYVRSAIGSVSKTYNSINPATLSGAIDVIVVEQEDGSLACSPFHVRFGKFSLLRPYEKKVEFKVNGEKQPYAMKLGEGGEAFFVFETSSDIPASLQTSPLVSPAQSPESLKPEQLSPQLLTEPSYLDISSENKSLPDSLLSAQTLPLPTLRKEGSTISDDILYGSSMPVEVSDGSDNPWTDAPIVASRGLPRSASEELLPSLEKDELERVAERARQEASLIAGSPEAVRRASASPPTLKPQEAYNRALTLSKKLSTSNIRSKVTDSGDLMLDMTGYKSSEDDALRAEAIARKILSEELEGNYDIGALIGTDENGNLWIYSSEEAKDAANRKVAAQSLNVTPITANDTSSDPGYHSDSDQGASPQLQPRTHQRAQSEEIQPPPRMSGELARNFAKTLRLTSDQLKELNLKPGPNPISFTVNRATCHAYMYYWHYSTPVVISDIDGTITKSDVLGHILNMAGRDWTHVGVAKLYSDIVANGYNMFYLTSRSVGQADTTRAYLNGVVQEGWRLPKGPVILSPDRTIAALRREVYLRKPEVFKMACLRDILGLFPGRTNPFYAGFGNRLTDALSYRTVNIPSSRIFTINSNAEVSLDLLSLNKYKSSYVSIREVVDHFFPSISTLVKDGGEQYTDFTYWRDTPQNLDDFVPTDSEDEGVSEEEEEDEYDDGLADSYMSRESADDSLIRDRIVVQDGFLGSADITPLPTEDDFASDYIGKSGRHSPGSPKR